ncbi:hypothetical protein [Aeromonas salmonicida]|uniref:hypothetical protein n=1 Tax=Aeromonas salmonicida TaxID=645 RepID=UPI003D1F0E30
MVNDIIIIDDNKNELYALSDAISEMGFPSLAVHFKIEKIAEIPKPSYISNGIRVIFVDINLAPSAGAPKISECATPVYKAIQNFIKTPYVLIFWTKSSESFDTQSLVNRIVDENKKTDIPYPLGCLLFHSTLSKSSVTNSNLALSTGGNSYCPKKIRSEIDKIFNENLFLSSIASWADSVSSSAYGAISDILNIPEKDGWMDGSRYQEKIKNLLIHLACSSGGKVAARNDIGMAVQESLVPLIRDKIAKNENSHSVGEKFNALFNNADINYKNDPTTTKTTPLINTTINIDVFESTRNHFIFDYGFVERGCFIEIKEPWIGNNYRNFHSFINRVDPSILKKNYFLKDNDFNQQLLKENSPLKHELNRCPIGLIEISAACDAANRKNIHHRGVFCLLIPTNCSSTIKCAGIDKQKYAHDGIQHIKGIYRIKNTDYHILINSREIHSFCYKTILYEQPLFRMREELTQHVIDIVSHYSSRTGIFSV